MAQGQRPHSKRNGPKAAARVTSEEDAGPTSSSGHEHVRGAGAIPSAGKKRDLESGYDERGLYVKQNRQHTMVPTKTQATCCPT
ncbi:hypothetical protein ABBQ32_003141 [Trebouxia sp. C0010 RCD-2024]